ncbi:hypothetical protein [Citrifermentans bremense]|uniref:hypothetical protein n=1 Tax=Citrifermentans bremense TaxID=60035 RepID=UPI0012ECA768|nr:hypothetical protein [Citrifermentans bremense]
MSDFRQETAFERAKLGASGEKCHKCGTLKIYPEMVAIFEEPYCTSVWLCEKCYPESEVDDDE